MQPMPDDRHPEAAVRRDAQAGRVYGGLRPIRFRSSWPARCDARMAQTTAQLVARTMRRAHGPNNSAAHSPHETANRGPHNVRARGPHGMASHGPRRSGLWSARRLRPNRDPASPELQHVPLAHLGGPNERPPIDQRGVRRPKVLDNDAHGRWQKSQMASRDRERANRHAIVRIAPNGEPLRRHHARHGKPRRHNAHQRRLAFGERLEAHGQAVLALGRHWVRRHVNRRARIGCARRFALQGRPQGRGHGPAIWARHARPRNRRSRGHASRRCRSRASRTRSSALRYRPQAGRYGTTTPAYGRRRDQCRDHAIPTPRRHGEGRCVETAALLGQLIQGAPDLRRVLVHGKKSLAKRHPQRIHAGRGCRPFLPKVIQTPVTDIHIGKELGTAPRAGPQAIAARPLTRICPRASAVCTRPQTGPRASAARPLALTGLRNSLALAAAARRHLSAHLAPPACCERNEARPSPRGSQPEAKGLTHSAAPGQTPPRRPSRAFRAARA